MWNTFLLVHRCCLYFEIFAWKSNRNGCIFNSQNHVQWIYPLCRGESQPHNALFNGLCKYFIATTRSLLKIQRGSFIIYIKLFNGIAFIIRHCVYIIISLVDFMCVCQLISWPFSSTLLWFHLLVELSLPIAMCLVCYGPIRIAIACRLKQSALFHGFCCEIFC